MKPSELRLEELVSFGDGRIDLHGRRLVLHGMDAFAQWRADLVRMVGADAARRMLTRFGYFTGQADAAALQIVDAAVGEDEVRARAVERAAAHAAKSPDVLRTIKERMYPQAVAPLRDRAANAFGS